MPVTSSLLFFVLIGVGAALIAVAATAAARAALLRFRVLDRPNARSAHQAPVPRGGGIGPLAAIAVVWLAIAGPAPADLDAPVILAFALALAILSFLDDLRGLSAAIRFAAQALAVALGLATLPPDLLVLQGWLPFVADRVLAGLAWLWFVNLYNFMDGSDGLAGVETVSIGVGVAVVAVVAGHGGPLPLYAVAAAGAGAGFLVWNWHPARIFLGDVGSIPLGYLLGWLLLMLACWGEWEAALILPLFFTADATLTLLDRARRGERVWEAHARHFYQRAVRRGLGHARVARGAIAANLVLLLLAAASAASTPPAPLLAAATVVGIFLWWLDRGADPGKIDPPRDGGRCSGPK